MNTSKIIKGAVSNGRYTVTAPIVKEDYGLYLQIEGVELPETYQVDFSNSENSGSSVTMIGNADGVLIPRQFISTGKDVFAFLYHVGADYGRTVYKFCIPNKLRPDRTDDTPTPEQQSVIDQAISALNEAVAQTAQDVIDAAASAQSAQGYAEQAETARDTAQTSANNAQTSATSAQVSASQASASATASAQSASATAQSASEATQAKQDAQDSANEAKGYATQASNSADDAQGHANTAHGYATDASNSADTATAKATEASGYAQTASQKATEASGYADTSSQKASESAQSATSAQGYAQTAETAKMDAQTAQGLAESARDSAVSAKNDAEQAKEDAETARDEAQSIVDGISGALDDKAPVITDTASGAIASFTDGADDLPLKSLVVNIDPVQDLSSGDPSPENICPISGWTSVDVEHTGKNLLHNLKAVGSGLQVNIGQEATGTSAYGVHLKAGTYTLSATMSTQARAYYRESDGTANTPIFGLGTDMYGTFTLSKESDVRIWLYNANGLTPADVLTFQLELGSTATPYEPYTGRSITIDLGQTVYGGKLDVMSGVMTVYPYYASYNGETLTGEWISDRDAYAVGTTPTIGAQVVNIGASGVTVQLSANQINSLYGVNNLWADSGDTEVEYRADTKLYIERLTAPDSTDMIADANITSGKYFMVGNSLYKATANIANGAQIIVGTNCIRKSLSEALNEINA